MRLFLDTDVILDVLLNRQPFAQDSGAVLDWAEAHPGQVAISWHGAANIHYLSHQGASKFLSEFLRFVEIPACGTEHLKQAIDLDIPDLEDAMQVIAAMQFRAQCIVTRNLPDFKNAPIKALSPKDILPLLA